MKKIILLVLLFSAIVSCNSQENTNAQNNVPNKSDVVVDNILSRRSIRKYQSQQIGKDSIDIIMKCAINAPSALNKQPWVIRVIRNEDILQKIKEFGGNFHGAPTLIIIGKDKSNSYASFDCGLLTQNILLSAESMDLGTCALGSVASVLNEPKSREVFDVLDFPENYDAAIAISIGYKAERPNARERDNGKIEYID